MNTYIKGKRINQLGFTLVELIIVIVILGILAVTALPKFIDVSADAKTARLQGIEAQIEGQISLIYSKLAVADLVGRNEARTHPVTGGGYYGYEPAHNPFNSICGEDCYFIYGTPSASNTTITSIMPDLGQDKDIVFAGYHSNDWQAQGVTGTNIVGTFAFRDNVNIANDSSNSSLKTDNCYIWYSGARADRSYKIGVVPCE